MSARRSLLILSMSALTAPALLACRNRTPSPSPAPGPDAASTAPQAVADGAPARDGDAEAAPAVGTPDGPNDGWRLAYTDEATPPADAGLLRASAGRRVYLRPKRGLEVYFRWASQKTWSHVEASKEGSRGPWAHLLPVVEYPRGSVEESGIAHFALVDEEARQACVLAFDLHMAEETFEDSCRPLPAAPASAGLQGSASLAATAALRYLEHCPGPGATCLLHGPPRATRAVRDPTEPPGGWHLVKVRPGREPAPREESARSGEVEVHGERVLWRCGYDCGDLVIERRNAAGELVEPPLWVAASPHVSRTDYSHTFLAGNGALVLVVGDEGHRVALLFTAEAEAILFDRPGEPGRTVRLGVDWSEGYPPITSLPPLWRLGRDGVLRPQEP